MLFRSIAKMDESMSGFELTLQTGNPVTDVIVGGIRRQSLDLGIRFQVEFHYPDPGAYDAFDVGIILQNLLQNAVEACEKVGKGERFIVLTGKRKGRFFLIEVKNSFSGEVVFGQDGLPVTTKQEDAPMHGIGLANVRREAEKYMGELELPVHVRMLLDEFANIGQIPQFEKLIATIRSREISASIILQSKSQLKAIYKDNADTIEGNCDTTLFLGGKEKTTLKELAEVLGKETIDLYNTSDTRGTSQSYGINYQKTGKELMSQDEIADRKSVV